MSSFYLINFFVAMFNSGGLGMALMANNGLGIAINAICLTANAGWFLYRFFQDQSELQNSRSVSERREK